MLLIDVDRQPLPRRPQDVIFEHIFKVLFYIVVSSIITIGKHIDMKRDKHREKHKKEPLYLHKICWQTSKRRMRNVLR